MSKFSVFDHSIMVDAENWVVAILRKPEAENPEHAFLMVEGRNEQNKAVLRRYDLFIDQKKPGHEGLVYIKPDIIVQPTETKEAVKQILNEDMVHGICWSITRQQAESLHQDILEDSKKPIQYQLSGDRSLLAKSNSMEGHSCFTWAREKLHNLKDERIHLDEKYSDFIAAIPSRYLKGESSEENTSKNCLVM